MQSDIVTTSVTRAGAEPLEREDEDMQDSQGVELQEMHEPDEVKQLRMIVEGVGNNSDDLDYDEEESDDDDDMDEDYDEDAADQNDLDDQGVQIPPGRAVSPSSLPFSGPASTSATDIPPHALNPQKQTPYVIDAGHLLISDPNPLTLPVTTNPAIFEGELASTARDAAQSLLNHLLTTCPIRTAPTTSTSSSGVIMSLPPPAFQLPREKKVPVPKPPTKWEKFAARKGIGKHNKSNVMANGDLASTEGKMVYDEAKGDWVPKWGYKGRNKRGEDQWLVEVDETKEKRKQEAANPRRESRVERKERVKRNERAQRANDRKTRKTEKA